MAESKLVRDRIPEIIKRNGENPQTHIALILEYEHLLNRKLLEEVSEFNNSKNRAEMIEELADVLEVIDAICRYHQIDKRAVLRAKKRKAKEKGRFRQRIVLENH